MEREARRQIAAGWSKQRIQAYFVAALGPQVLAIPKSHGFDLLAWLLPLVGILAGAVVLGAAAWRWTSARAPATAAAPPLDPELERRVDEELARFEP